MTRELLQQALDALENVTQFAEAQICMHEETYRGGVLWEICSQCGAKWADDEGGKPKFKWPKETNAARKAIIALRSAIAAPAPAVPAEDFCYCNDACSLQMVSGGAAKEGLYGRVTLLIDGKYVDYVREESAAPAVREPLTTLELELLDILIESQLEYGNMRRVELLRKLRGIGGGGKWMK